MYLVRNVYVLNGETFGAIENYVLLRMGKQSSVGLGTCT
jgi:hypothetical protein